MMAYSPAQKAALDELDKIVKERKKVSAYLKAAKKAAKGDAAKLAPLKRATVKLNEHNLRTYNARRKIIKGSSMGAGLAKLQDLTSDARDAVDNLNKTADFVKAVDTFVKILTKISAIV